MAEAKEALCSVCSEEGTDDNPIVYCDVCDVGVHPTCYGAPLSVEIPADDWLCDRCLYGAQNSNCVLCPVKEGAMKRTTDLKWMHLACAMWIPQCFFRQSSQTSAVDYHQIPLEHWNQQCVHCNSTDGVCLSCSDEGCLRKFHVTCGLQNGIFLEYVARKGV